MRSTDTHVFFWGGPFSNWNRSSFPGEAAVAELLPRLDRIGVAHPAEDSPLTRLLKAHRFNCGEQFMMAAKAWMFDDATRLRAILAETDPKKQKLLGRDVSPFFADVWDAACVDIVASGAIARFSANPSQRKQLLDTGERVLVEGSPRDRLWGVGLDWRDERIEDPLNWRGRNLLGKALAIARAELSSRYAPRRRFAR
ncbi:NADAR family protein [Erythrobacter aureus]|uniref:DUF1768 domain-containing protein n=1 Tax=Erythrobacter aureus TaxID=2182384 RepID=A0A345YIX4_9SPHN|nr:NADAR family protein [Erythrobacter aureus]AXK43876.1 DUF1768 domain-containing protein [Erythrobacter aureus]